MTELSKDQREALLRPLNPGRVLIAQGQSHLPAYDVVAHLTRTFGFEGWDKTILDMWMVEETLEDYTTGRGEAKKGWNVTYGCRMRLTIRAQDDYGNWEDVKHIDDAATGSANHIPQRGEAHDFAVKNAVSYAIKRCAKDLGDQFGLSLYNNGSTAPLLKRIVPYGLTTTNGEGPEGNVEPPKSLGNDEKQVPEVDA